jgi:hypothetical protein
MNMSMTTVFRTKTGLFVNVSTKCITEQSVLKKEEIKFHRRVRKDIVKNKDFLIKYQSSCLNAKEIHDLQTQVIIAYCKKKGWPCKDNKGEVSFKNLSKCQLDILWALPKVVAYNFKLR